MKRAKYYKQNLLKIIRHMSRGIHSVEIKNPLYVAIIVYVLISLHINVSYTYQNTPIAYTAKHTSIMDSKPEDKIAGQSAIPLNSNQETNIDERVQKLEAFLAYHNSPLTEYADTFVEAADEHGLDWRWVPAITGTESTFGKHIPYNSYNAYGWANGEYAFGSWEESINHVTKVLKEKYVARGADTIEKIAPIYAPPSTTWAGKVQYFVAKIDNFSPQTTKSLALAL